MCLAYWGAVCVCIGVFLRACVLPANDHCFRDPLPSFSLLLSISLFSAPLTSNLVPQPPVSPTTPFLSPPLPPNTRCRFKQPALCSADTLSMQIESPPPLSVSLPLSFLFPRLPLFAPFQRLCGNEGVLLVRRDLHNLPFLLHSHLRSLSLSLALVLSLSHDVSSLFLLLVTLIRSLCEPELTCVLMWTEDTMRLVAALACQVSF